MYDMYIGICIGHTLYMLALYGVAYATVLTEMHIQVPLPLVPAFLRSLN